MKCTLCNNPIPEFRIQSRKKTGGTLKYCSIFCCKKSFYQRNFKGKHTVFQEGYNFNSCTQKGLYWENYIAQKLNGECISNKIMNKNIDVIAGKEKFDIKSSNLYKRKKKKGKNVINCFGWWVFNRNTFKDEIDFFICICLIDNKIEKIYKIPNNKFHKKGITIGKKSKYDEFLIDI